LRKREIPISQGRNIIDDYSNSAAAAAAAARAASFSFLPKSHKNGKNDKTFFLGFIDLRQAYLCTHVVIIIVLYGNYRY
jgi:hypothetical protein